jgi:Flp pilus assembly protein TadG
MRRITRNTDIAQRGQALVLTALMLVVLLGFAGLAIDGGRAYWERRILQNALDAGALAASDNYQDSQSISTAVHALATEYAANELVYGAASSSSWTATTQDLSWAGSSNTVHVVINVATITTFDVTSTKTFRLAFMPVLGVGPNLTIGAHAQSRAKTGGVSGVALLTLSSANCAGGSPDSLVVAGSNSSIVVSGADIWVNGATQMNSGSITVQGAGRSFHDRCSDPPGQDPPNGVSASNQVGGAAPLSDPNLPVGPLANYSSAQVGGTNVVLNPGTYAGDPSGGGSSCYFLAPGVYQMNAGINASVTGQVLSNELRPPDEPTWTAGAANYNNSVSANQMWGGCKGTFAVTQPVSAPGLTPGWYGVVVTTTRTDYYPPQSMGGTNYARESFPSTCHAIQVVAGHGVNVAINNVPGAQGYNVYFAYNAGSSPCNQLLYGYVGGIAYVGTQTSGALGSVNATFNATNITTLPTPANIGTACLLASTTPLCAAATGAFGAANPPGDGSETAPFSASSPAASPVIDSASNGGGDRANEHESLFPGVTPGAVQMYFPASQCLSMSQGTLWIFGGAQYSWVTIYAPQANTCSTNTFSGNSILAAIGTIYAPKWALAVTGNGSAPLAGQVIVGSFQAAGNASVTIAYDNQAVGGQGFSQISG